MNTFNREAQVKLESKSCPSPHTITALLVVYHEENYIRGALQSIAGVVDHIVVVHDGPCSDDTLKIATEFTKDVSCMPEHLGSALFIFPTVLKRLNDDWVLVIDGDERLSPELRNSLRSLAEDRTADSYGFAWPYVNTDLEPVGRVSLSGKRFLFRRSKMYSIGLPHMTPDTYGRNISRLGLEVWHVMKHVDTHHQMRRIFSINRRRARLAATILAGGAKAVTTFNADVFDNKAKNVRKIHLFVKHPVIALITVPLYRFLHRYFVMGYFKAGLIGLHDALNMPLYYAWICIYRIRDRLKGVPGTK